jgi:hypothetical protein
MLLITTVITAQQFYLEGGKTLSSFDYTNSEGDGLDNLQSSAHSFMAVGYKKQVLLKNLNWSLGSSYNSSGAIGSDNIGNFMEWNLNFLEFNTGLDYSIFSIENFAFYVKGSTSIKFLIQGTQSINNVIYDLMSSDVFKKTLFDFRAGLGFSHPISERLSFYVQYIYGKSSDLATSDEELKIVNKQLSFGLLINLFNTEKETNKKEDLNK